MKARLKAIAKRCKNRGGDCSCGSMCQGVREVEAEIANLIREKIKVDREIASLKDALRRLSTKPATLRSDFQFSPGLEPVMVFDGDEAHFGYEDEDGEWTDCGEWPFNEDYVWPDDCERLGIRVE